MPGMVTTDDTAEAYMPVHPTDVIGSIWAKLSVQNCSQEDGSDLQVLSDKEAETLGDPTRITEDTDTQIVKVLVFNVELQSGASEEEPNSLATDTDTVSKKDRKVQVDFK